MTKITVDKDLIEQAINAAFSPYCTQDLAILVPALRAALAEPAVEPTYTSTQATTCASCGEHKHTPLRIDQMGGYVCLTCIDQRLGSLLGEFGYPEETSAVEPVAWRAKDANGRWMYGHLPAPELPADAPQLLFASPPPPAKVPLLSIKELADLTAPWAHIRSDHSIGIAQAAEKAVRQKAGLK